MVHLMWATCCGSEELANSLDRSFKQTSRIAHCRVLLASSLQSLLLGVAPTAPIFAESETFVTILYHDQVQQARTNGELSLGTHVGLGLELGIWVWFGFESMKSHHIHTCSVSPYFS